MSHFPTIIDIQPILNDVNNVVKRGIHDLIYEYNHLHLTRELEKCKAEMEYYKNELELFKKCNSRLNIFKENISLNIEETSDTQSVDNDCTIEKILLQNEITYKNERVSLPESSDSEEQEDQSESEEKEEMDTEAEEEQDENTDENEDEDENED
jgi:hypothetical protein